jgi:hypothetical protein
MPEIGISGTDTIHLTWWETSAAHKIPYRRSIDGGKSWSAIVDLVGDSVGYPKPLLARKMAVEGSEIWIFSGGESNPLDFMALSKSTNAGETWVTRRTGFDKTNNIKSASANGDTLVAIIDQVLGGHIQEPRLIYSTDNGFNWTMHPDTFMYWTSAALTPGTLHVIVNRGVNGTSEVQYLRSTNLGETFEPAVILSPLDDRGALEHDFVARTTSKGGVIAAVWRDEMECEGFLGCTVLFRASTDNGVSWGMITPITESPMGFVASVTLAPDGRPGVAWAQEIEWMSPVHTFTRLEAQSGIYWLPSYDNSTPSTSSGSPNIAISSKAVHVVWGEVFHDENGRWCIYYQRGEFVKENEVVVTYEGDWNLVSVPMVKDTTYDIFTPVYGFDGAHYSHATQMHIGRGYWAKMIWRTVRFEGDSLTTDTIDVKKGWNIIGSISSPVATTSITTIPGGIVTSGYFGFVGSQYQETTMIEPGRAYWVKVNQTGRLILRIE